MPQLWPVLFLQQRQVLPRLPAAGMVSMLRRVCLLLLRRRWQLHMPLLAQRAQGRASAAVSRGEAQPRAAQANLHVPHG